MRLQNILSLKGILLLLLSLASLFVDYFLFSQWRPETSMVAFGDHALLRSQDDLKSSYSWNGSDFPTFLPLKTAARHVKVTIEESNRFSITDPEAADEWLWTAPVGDNHVRLGPHRRMFAVAMFHQMHCLRMIRLEIERGSSGTNEHTHHCFNYIKQWILCDADTTLERGDFTKRDFNSQRTAGDYMCRDWKPVYEFVKGNWKEWKGFQVEHGLEDI